VQKLLDIKRLLHQEGYTIAGARKRLREEAGEVGATPAVDAAWIERVRREVRDLLAVVDADGRDGEAT
jgi:hypothetical protein